MVCIDFGSFMVCIDLLTDIKRSKLLDGDSYELIAYKSGKFLRFIYEFHVGIK
jgi:hypothetical protein